MAYGADVVLQQVAFINAAALPNGGHKFSYRANFVSKPANSAWKRKSANSAMSRDWRQHRAEKQHLNSLIISGCGLFVYLSTAVELYAVHGLHGIDVAHLETTSLLLSHLTLWLLIGPKQCHFKRRQSWALHIEAISTTQEYPCCSLKSDNRCWKDSYAYLQHNCWPRLNSCWLKYVETFSISQELYSVVSVGLWLKPSGARLVWSSFNEGSDKGNDERALMRLHDLSQLLAFYTLLRWPQTPCHQAHTCPCACTVLFSFDLGRRVDPVRFSLFARSPMVRTLLCSNSRLSMQCVPGCTQAEVGLL